MSGFRVLLRKELLEAWRTRRIPVVAVLFLVVGIISPLTARYLPEILTAALGDQLPIPVPPPVAADALLQLQKNLGQLGALAAIALAMGSVSGELDRGTAALVLAQPATRGAFLAAKLIAIGVVLAIAVAAATVVAWVYTAILFEPLPVAGWVAMAVLSWLALLAWAALTFLASAATGSTTAAAGLGFVALVVISLASIVPALDRLLPSGLSAPAIQLASGGAVADAGAALTAVLGTIGPDRRGGGRGAALVPLAGAVTARESKRRPARAPRSVAREAGRAGPRSGPGLALEAALEALDLAGGVDDVLLAREERVAVAADVHAHLVAGAADLELRAAGPAVDLRLHVSGVDVGLHVCAPSTPSVRGLVPAGGRRYAGA